MALLWSREGLESEAQFRLFSFFLIIQMIGTMALGGAAGFIGNKMTGNHMGGFSSIAGGAMAAQGAKMLYGMFDKNKDHGKPSHNQQYGGGYNQGYQQGEFFALRFDDFTLTRSRRTSFHLISHTCLFLTSFSIRSSTRWIRTWILWKERYLNDSLSLTLSTLVDSFCFFSLTFGDLLFLN